MEAHEARTRICLIRLDEHGIIRVVAIAGASETLADAQDSIRACGMLAGGVRRPIFVDMREMKSQDREARLYYSSPEAVRVGNAVALLVGSRVSTLIANFFITVTKTTIPTKLFTDEAEAVAWLKGFLP